MPICARRDGERVELAVEDDGVGMDPGVLAEINNRLSGDASRNRRAEAMSRSR